MTTRIVVCGAAGRMGRTLVTLISQTQGAKLAGAVEAPGHPALGYDAGELAGIGALGVNVVASYDDVARGDTVALDFTNAETALANLRTAVERQAGIVIGTTGFSPDQRGEIDRLAPRTRCLVAPNMSVGIAVLQKIAAQAAAALGADFDIEIVEMHHRMKVDAPSGTALSLANSLAQATNRDMEEVGIYGRQGVIGRRTAKEIGVLALRGGDVVGDHTVILAGLGERLELTHRAHSRDCLARGAVRAALWLANQPVGRYAIADTLGW